MRTILRISNDIVIHSHHSCLLFYSFWSMAPILWYVCFLLFFFFTGVFFFFNKGERNLAFIWFILKELGIKTPSLASVKRF